MVTRKITKFPVGACLHRLLIQAMDNPNSSIVGVFTGFYFIERMPHHTPPRFVPSHDHLREDEMVVFRRSGLQELGWPT